MISSLLNLIAPDNCLECNTEGSIWCDWCRLQHEPLPSRCFNCHAQTENFAVCNPCKKQTSLRNVYVVSEYTDVAKQLVLAMKYDCKRHVCQPIARAMADNLPYLDPTTIVVSVPTALVRVRQRGFDHTKLIAKELTRLKGLRQQTVLIKVNNSRQVGASKKVRKTQVIDSFRIKRGVNLKNASVLLVDDVITTGATLAEATRLLKKAGAKSVIAAVFAYAK